MMQYARLSVLSFVFAMALLFVSGNASGQNTINDRPLDVVFCLDLSGSTNGLLTDVRDNLWLISNELDQLSPRPALRIGIVGFSRPSFGKNNAYVKVLSDLTNDLDHVAAELYRLKPSIEKGDQIVSAALNTAINDLSWSKDEQATKIIFIVGNGMVTANGYEYVKSCESAVAKNIIINSVYVMKSNWFKEITGWRRIATISGGMQMEVTINKAEPVAIWKSDWKALSKVNTQLNGSFMWTGSDSSYCRKEMATSDSGAFYAGMETFCHRLYYKSSDRFLLAIRHCDLYYSDSNNNLSESSAEQEVSHEKSAFDQRVEELSHIRKEKFKQVRELLSDQPPKDLFNQYATNALTDEGIFHRIILKVILKQWKP
jgi:hypothetical protein